jgi:glycosyltransferase involved in cell wall biosynthesis
LGYLGNFSPGKGLEGLFQIAEILSQQISRPWELALAGGAIDEAGERWVEELKERYRSAEWWSRVQWKGWVDRPRQFIGSLDVMIFPSTRFDSFPTVLLEAGWAGVPVVATRVGGAGEIVQQGQTGWLFDPEDWAEAARKLTELSRQPDRLSAAGVRARRRMEKCFGVDKMVARYRELYSTLVQNG